jgi:hypothetical protein
MKTKDNKYFLFESKEEMDHFKLEKEAEHLRYHSFDSIETDDWAENSWYKYYMTCNDEQGSCWLNLSLVQRLKEKYKKKIGKLKSLVKEIDELLEENKE